MMTNKGHDCHEAPRPPCNHEIGHPSRLLTVPMSFKTIHFLDQEPVNKKMYGTSEDVPAGMARKASNERIEMNCRGKP